MRGGPGRYRQTLPDTDPTFRGGDSRAACAMCWADSRQGLAGRQCRSTIVARKRRRWPRISKPCARLHAEDLQVELDQVNVKATTPRSLVLPGVKKAFAVHAVALLVAQ